MKHPKASRTPVERAVILVRRRLVLRQWVQFTLSGLFYATVFSTVWLLLSRVFPQLWDASVVLGVTWGAALPLAAFWAVWKRPNLVQSALAADECLGLKERFTSSLALRGDSSRMVEALHRDAEFHLKHLNPARDFPLLQTRSLRWFLFPVLLFGLGYMLLPEMDLFEYESRALEAKARARTIESKAQVLRHAAKLLKPEDDAPAAALKAPAAELEQVAEALSRQEITEKQALARVTNLSQQIQKEREQLEQRYGAPPLTGDPNKLGASKEVAKDIQNGQFSKAAQKLRELQKKMEDNKLSPEEKKQLAKDLKSLQKMLTPDSEMAKALSDALGEASEAMDSGDTGKAAEALKAMELSLDDMASALEQLAKLESVTGQLGEWKQGMLGPSGFCRSCGKKLGKCDKVGQCKGGCEGKECSGMCGSCAGSGTGLGLGGPGRGQGNRVGELPDEDVAYQPTILPGGMDKGKLLANVLQKTAPEGEAVAEVEIISGNFEAAHQEAEQALTQEEIPRGSKEFVRQYFGTLDPAAAAP